MKILIKVTKEILERSKGCQRQSDSCAISQAVREIFPAALVISGVINTGFNYAIELPEAATCWYIVFDRSTNQQIEAMPEFSFEIDVPNEVIEKIGLGEVYKILSESKTLELVAPL